MLVSNFGQGNVYNTNPGDYWVTPSNPVVGDPIGFIDPSNTYYSLMQIQIATDLAIGAGTAAAYNEVSVGFWESPTNNLSGAVEVESWNLVTPANQPNAIYTLTSSANPIIKPDEYYFITENVLPNPGPAAAQSAWGWQWTTIPESENEDAEPGMPPIFAISGDPDAPEPRSAWLVAAGIAGFLILQARRRFRLGHVSRGSA